MQTLKSFARKLMSFKFFTSLGIVILAVLTASFTVLFSHPLDAASVRQQHYQQLVREGIIDGVRTPHELGLDYLQQTPPPLTASLLNSIGVARNTVQNTNNITRKIPLPSPPNATVRSGTPLPNGRIMGTSTSTSPGRYVATGSINRRNGQEEPINNRGLDEMFAIEQRGGGDFNEGVRARSAPIEQQSWLADASGRFLQARRSLVIDIVAFDTYDGRTYIIPDVDINAFCRDALNAVLEGTWW